MSLLDFRARASSAEAALAAAESFCAAFLNSRVSKVGDLIRDETRFLGRPLQDLDWPAIATAFQSGGVLRWGRGHILSKAVQLALVEPTRTALLGDQLGETQFAIVATLHRVTDNTAPVVHMGLVVDCSGPGQPWIRRVFDPSIVLDLGKVSRGDEQG